jgi:two-component system, chemotaxis family, protein-glutamate methylesterase/glutaminase
MIRGAGFMRKIKVLVVDDSAFMRKVIADLLSQDPFIEIIDKARNGKEAVKKVKELLPDVVTMDVEMPEMNGLEALQTLMREHPVPVVMLSSLTHVGTTATIHALELGAVDFIAKPSGSISLDIHKVQKQLIEKVKTAAKAKINHLPLQSASSQIHSSNSGTTPTDQQKRELSPTRLHVKLPNIIAMGTSTGGPKALQVLLTSLPQDLAAAILIVQHMPPGFTKSLSQRLDSLCRIHVVEAEDGMQVASGCAYIAPGDFHMGIVKRNDGNFYISLNRNDPKSGHRPSVDLLFDSFAKLEHPSKYAIIMTGMGSDGTEGLKMLKESGCVEAIAEDESTCVVYGMPRSAVLSGKIDRILPLPEIGPYLTKRILL